MDSNSFSIFSTGGNFEFFPPNSRLSVVEPNAFFEPMFYERQSKYPSLKMERFVLGKAEDMKDIEDGSMDIVVSTVVMCSVQSIEKSLKEIQRVLAPVNILLIINFLPYNLSIFFFLTGWKILLLGTRS